MKSDTSKECGDQNIGWKMQKKNMQLACIGLLMFGLFNSPLCSYYPLVMTNIAMVKITMLLSSVNHLFSIHGDGKSPFLIGKPSIFYS